MDVNQIKKKASLMPEQTQDIQGFGPLLRMISDRIKVSLANRSYDADLVREKLFEVRIEAIIADRRNSRAPAPHDRDKSR
ncbi:hypothetical protein GCM10007872_26120 [Gluconobacter sphaericus NBRC 12467]|uniref:Uncharacterized protein n=1 Tax=Gluconobacter sphaericus NBRC 12467 TaxID=1307951 RepID=A0AA37WB24_9PROT|nr:transposase [Gluconobacter sphaericus NBRC 12467]GEB43499.1 hypothetical protein GSP01_22810 [Gluconobacter sphaericus NBRC 12467]GLQ85702.1 hypothetical protein GCM10007872_26120 [Gluconobacter sphaericus NBRC 12467]